ncbi:MAG TPA: trypsin-like peptidase domain-containing protein [Mycobacteriales bacterium]|nr:trypsin-like peptidase domain-containing protein [Mycobacteriales bacterium]
MTEHDGWSPPQPPTGPAPDEPTQWWSPPPPLSPRGLRAAAPGVSVGVAALIAVVAAVLGGAVGGLLVHGHNGGNGSVRTVTLGATSAPDISSTGGQSIATVARRILPSVVSIQVKSGNGGDTGSGIVLSKAGYIMTNNHVIAAASSGGTLSVILPDKARVPATVVGHPDTVDDIAIVKVKGVSDLTPVALGNSNELAVGDPVVAVGSPLGLAGTVTSGIISALNRPVEAGGEQGIPDDVIDAIQTDAAINPGNSGGPLVDLDGRVIGVNSAIASLSTDGLAGQQSGSIGLGFAIPINEAKRIAEQIITRGYSTHAIIGVQLNAAYAGQGAEIGTGSSANAVTPGGPASKAGLEPGDIIVGVDNERITTADELIVAIRSRVPGQRITVTYLRDGQRHKVSIVLGSSRST